MKVSDYHGNKDPLISETDLVLKLTQIQSSIKSSKSYSKNEEIKLINYIIAYIGNMEIKDFK